MEAYVKGARCGNAQHAELEGSTAVFSRRRFRDKWNRTIVRRLARTRTHTARVKARVRARGVTGQQFFNDRQDDGLRLQLTLVHPHSSLAQRLNPTCGLLRPRPGRTELCRAKARTQQIWSLMLAGDWHPEYETKVPSQTPHYMRTSR